MQEMYRVQERYSLSTIFVLLRLSAAETAMGIYSWTKGELYTKDSEERRGVSLVNYSSVAVASLAAAA